MGAISEIKSAVDLLQELLKYIKKSANHDPQVLSSLEELRGKILDAYSTEIDLTRKIHKLEEQLAIRKLPYDADMATYYQVGKDGKKEFYCQRCADADSKLCRLQERECSCYCTTCKEIYKTAAQSAASPGVVFSSGGRNRWEGF